MKWGCRKCSAMRTAADGFTASPSRAVGRAQSAGDLGGGVRTTSAGLSIHVGGVLLHHRSFGQNATGGDELLLRRADGDTGLSHCDRPVFALDGGEGRMGRLFFPVAD